MKTTLFILIALILFGCKHDPSTTPTIQTTQTDKGDDRIRIVFTTGGQYKKDTLSGLPWVQISGGGFAYYINQGNASFEATATDIFPITGVERVSVTDTITEWWYYTNSKGDWFTISAGIAPPGNPNNYNEWGRYRPKLLVYINDSLFTTINYQATDATLMGGSGIPYDSLFYVQYVSIQLP